jgi:hypothetical protein
MNQLPVPRTVSGWFLSVLLILVSFIWYYNGGIFDKVNEQYYGNSSLPGLTSIGQDDFEVTVQIPGTISRFAARELIITVTAKKDVDDATILISEANSLVWLCAKGPAIFSGCEESQNFLEFNSLKAGEQKTKILWVIVAPRVLLKTNNAKYTFSSVDGNLLSFGVTAKTESKIDKSLTFKNSFLSTLLLPPWANGFIPVLVLFVVYLFEHKIQPGQKFRRRGLNEFRNETVTEAKTDIGGS